MLDIFVHLQAAELRYAYTFRQACSRQVVAQQIDDHNVFRAVLLTGTEIVSGEQVSFRPACPAARAFDRARLDVTIVDPSEPLGRCADYLPVAAIQVAGKRSRVAAA